MEKILYFSDSKFPLAGLAGAIHTGRLPADREPDGGELWKLPFLNSVRNIEGQIFYMGVDGQGNEVYALSINGERGMAYRLVENFLEIYKIPEDELKMIDSGLSDNVLLLAGGFLCRSDFLASIGHFFISAGVKKSYDKLTQLVTDVKAGQSNLP